MKKLQKFDFRVAIYVQFCYQFVIWFSTISFLTLSEKIPPSKNALGVRFFHEQNKTTSEKKEKLLLSVINP